MDYIEGLGVAYESFEWEAFARARWEVRQHVAFLLEGEQTTHRREDVPF